MTKPTPPALPAVSRMIRWPVILSVVVLAVRLAGELEGWDHRFFATAGGPSLAAVGVVWLIPLFGLIWGFVIAGRGHAPDRPGLAMTLSALGALAIIGASMLSIRSLAWPMTPIGLAVGAVVALGFTWRAWPELLRYTFRYALLVRVAVVLITVPAVFFAWNTHFDALPTEITLEAKLDRLAYLASVQLLGWVPATCALCGVSGGFAALLRGRRDDDAIDD